MSAKTLDFIEKYLWRWMSFVSRKPYETLGVITFSALLGALLAFLFIGIDSDTSRMVSSKLDYRKAHIELTDAFPRQETDITLIVRGRTQDETDAFTRILVDRLNIETEAVEDVFSPISDPFFRQNGLLYLDIDDLEQTLPRISEAAPLIRRLGANPSLNDLYSALLVATDGTETGEPVPEAMNRALDAATFTIDAVIIGNSEPMSWQALFDSDSNEETKIFQQIVSVSPVLDYSRLQPAQPAVIAVNKIVDELVDDQGFQVTVGVTGEVALRMEEMNAIRNGIGLALTASLVFVSIILFLALRSFQLVAACLAALIVSILVTAGFGAVVFGDLNLVSVAFAVLLIGLGIDFSIHLALHVQEERSKGQTSTQALQKTSKHIGTALVLCAPTSALAFFAFAPTKFVGMAQLGIISGVGVLVAFVVAMSLLPALFALMPQAENDRKREHFETLNISQRWQTRAAVTVLALGALALTQLPNVRFNADPMALRDQSSQSVLAFNTLFDDPDTQPFTLSILEGSEEAAVVTATHLETLPTVHRAISVANFVPEDQFDKLDLIEVVAFNLEFAFDDAANTASASKDENVRTKLLERLKSIGSEPSLNFADAIKALHTNAIDNPNLLETARADLFAYWPMQLERLREQLGASEFEVDDLPAALRNRFISEATNQYRVQIEPVEDLREKIARTQFVDEVRAEDNRAAGAARSVLQSGVVISQAMVSAIIFALIAVATLLWIILRDGALVAIIVFCLCLAGLLTMAASALMGMPFNFANIIVLPLLFGVGADSGIHLGLRMMNKDDRESIYETSTPRAVFYSAITTIATFGTLSFSAHQGVSSMGVLLAVAIGFTLLCTVFVQPWLIDKLLKRS